MNQEIMMIKNDPISEIPIVDADTSETQDQDAIRLEMEEMRGKLSDVLFYIAKKEKEADEKKENPTAYADNFVLPPRPMVTKNEAAALLMISPRQLQRVRHRLKLKWEMVGRETHYSLKELVKAIWDTQCPWDIAVYEKILNRVTRLPKKRSYDWK